MISIDQLTFGYKKNQPVLDKLSMQLKPGHIYGLLGRNGAGKSSLLYNICGLLFPNSGACQVLGQTPGKRNPLFLQQVFLLSEEFYTPHVTVKQYINTYSVFYPAFSRDMFNQYMEAFEMSANQRLQAMSYGQKKKMLICFALATNAKVLLLDEPTNGLDVPSKKQFRKIIAGSIQDDQVIIISTHQVRDLDSLIDNVLILEDKNIIINQTVADITAKLAFKQVMRLEDVADPIYSEGGLKGYAVITANHTHESTRLDMEMFFNAVLSEKQQIVPLFN
jgi:ABC-2 type transport system ATP-binding protein